MFQCNDAFVHSSLLLIVFDIIDDFRIYSLVLSSLLSSSCLTPQLVCRLIRFIIIIDVTSMCRHWTSSMIILDIFHNFRRSFVLSCSTRSTPCHTPQLVCRLISWPSSSMSHRGAVDCIIVHLFLHVSTCFFEHLLLFYSMIELTRCNHSIGFVVWDDWWWCISSSSFGCALVHVVLMFQTFSRWAMNLTNDLTYGWVVLNENT